MRRTKEVPTRSPAPPVVARGVDALFELDRRRKLARITQSGSRLRWDPRQPETDPRRPFVGRIQTLLATARGNLKCGHRADWQMAEIEALAGRMNRVFLEPLGAHGARMNGGRRPGGRYRAAFLRRLT
jgi:hypothetical protein